MNISVIVPTYNRKDALIKCLNALFEQDCSKSKFEILVVDDGSTDGTSDIIREIIQHSPARLRYFKQKNKGPAAARNVGIKNASGKTILLIGDDIIATQSLIDEHLIWNERYSDENVAILGHVTWSPRVRVTPFLKYLEETGVQFGYPLITNPDNVPYNFFYTSNVSVKKYFLLKHGLFDEDFPYAAWEDIELAYRLRNFNLKILYNRYAVGYHDHFVNRNSFKMRALLSGRALAILHRKHPDLQKYHTFDDRFSSNVILKQFIWKLPWFLAQCVPKRHLHASYNYVISTHIRKGYKECQKSVS